MAARCERFLHVEYLHKTMSTILETESFDGGNRYFLCVEVERKRWCAEDAQDGLFWSKMSSLCKLWTVIYQSVERMNHCLFTRSDANCSVNYGNGLFEEILQACKDIICRLNMEYGS